MKQHPLPQLVDCYWVLPGQLLAGEYPLHDGSAEALQRLDELLAVGIDSFVDLTEDDELISYAHLLEDRARRRGMQVSYRRFPIRDLGLPRPPDMRATLDHIDRALADGRRVYVHCWGGVGRTGMTVGCFLVRHGRTGQEALDQIARWWAGTPMRQYSPQSPETPEQVQFVLDWREFPSAGYE